MWGQGQVTVHSLVITIANIDIDVPVIWSLVNIYIITILLSEHFNTPIYALSQNKQIAIVDLLLSAPCNNNTNLIPIIRVMIKLVLIVYIIMINKAAAENQKLDEDSCHARSCQFGYQAPH